jgi:hypothetical protein
MINILAIILNFIGLADAVQEKFTYIYLELFNLCYVFFMKVTVFIRENSVFRQENT